MICKLCRRAGELNTRANRTLDPAEVEQIRANARAYHSYCQPGWCDCQHIVNDVINRERLSNAVHL
jgi:hypothetical protein